MTTDQELQRGRTCVFALHVHLVFVTKYRRRVLTGAMLEAMRPVLDKVCADFGAALVEFEGEDDHVHLLVEYPPTVAVSALVNSVEGCVLPSSSPAVPGAHPCEHLWSPSYFAASCGGAPLAIIRAYVESQRTPG